MANRPFHSGTIVPLLLVCMLSILGAVAPALSAPPTLPPLPNGASAAAAANAPAPQILYDGSSVGEAGLQLSPWGGGTCGDTTDVDYDNGHSIRVTTQDLYQGGQISWSTPVDLGDRTDKSRYLVLTLRQGHPASDQMSPPLKIARLVFTLADGSSFDITRDLAPSFDHWFDVAVPISVMSFPATSGQSPLQSIMLAADDSGILYVGRVRIATDNSPITCFAGAQQTASWDRPVSFTGSADGGLSTLAFSWDFDTEGAFVDQADGMSVQNNYPQGDKTYTVTLRVTDVDGIKAPATSTTTVQIE